MLTVICPKCNTCKVIIFEDEFLRELNMTGHSITKCSECGSEFEIYDDWDRHFPLGHRKIEVPNIESYSSNR